MDEGTSSSTDQLEADAGFEARLCADGKTFDIADAALLRAVDEHGSLNAATGALGRSYARGHARLKDLEAAFGPLVVSQRGGPNGGGSRLTGGARDLLARFERLQTAFSGTARAEETVLDGYVVTREGELATVRTAAGRMRALTPPDAERVEVTLRADAVTLQVPDGSPPADATSARNRLRGSVTSIDCGKAVARVAVDVGLDAPLAALVTVDSVERLDLDQRTEVVASIKATATRATERG